MLLNQYGQDNFGKDYKNIEVWTHISTLKKLKLAIVDDVLGG